MARFGQSFINSLINPSYADQMTQVGMLGGSLMGRRRAAEEEKAKKLREAQIASMMATGEGATERAALMRNRAQGVLSGQVASAQDPGLAAIAQRGALQSGVKPTDVKAAAELAEKQQEARATKLAEQKQAEAAQAAVARARAMGYPSETIAAYENNPEDLNALVDHADKQKAADRLNKDSEKAQINRQTLFANQRGADEKVLQDIRDGRYVGQNAELMGMLRGEGDSIGSFQNIESGEVSALTTLNGKVFVNGKWVNPSEAGLVKAPTRTAEDTTATFTQGQRSTRTSFSALSSGVIEDFVNETESIGDLQKGLTEVAVNPFTRDKTSRLRQIQDIVPDSLARLQSGAAIKEDEMGKFNDAFKVQVSDVFSPQMMALKTIRTLLVSETASRLTTGELTPPQARARVQEIAAMGLSESDKEKLADGQFKAVIKPYISRIKGESSDSEGPRRIRFDAQGNRI